MNRCVEETESLGFAKRRRNSVDVEEGHRGSRLRSSRDCDAKEHVSRDGDQTNREVQEWKRVQGTRGGEHQKLWAASHVRQDFRGNCAQEHVAGCRRKKTSGVGMTHQPGWERLVHWEE